MGARTGPALKFLQWFLRLLQFLSAALVFGVYSYFLATLANHSIHIPNSVRAVEGISGAAVLYSIAGLLLLCCLAGRALTSLVAMAIDFAFIPAFIYVATANKHGAGSCSGYLDTPFGKGKDEEVADGDGGFTALPSFHVACRLQTACLAVSIILIFFFIFSLLTELFLARSHQKEKRFGPSPANDYTSGYASGNVFSRLFGRKRKDLDGGDILPAHTTPGQLDGHRQQSVSHYNGVYDLIANNPDPDGLYIHSPNTIQRSPHYDVPGEPETGYGYARDVGTPVTGSHNKPSPSLESAGSSPPQRDYRYGDGIYDRP